MMIDVRLPLLALLSTLALCGADYFPPPDSKGGWRTRQDAALTAKLDKVFDYVQTTTQHGGLLVVHQGHLVYERYFGRGHREALPELASVGKAFTSLATAIVMREHPALFPQGLDTRIFSPKLLPAAAFPLNDPRKEQISIGQVLSMSAGIRGTNPVYVKGARQTWPQPTEDNGPYSTTDGFALNQTLWCNPGECYSYSTASSHIPAIMVRHVAGMEMEEYLRKHLAGPLGFGTWGYAMYRPKLKGGIDANGRMLHTPGGGSIAVRSTDMLRFGYLMLRQGRWGKRQVVPADFAKLCAQSVSYNPHFTHSFNFNNNDDGHIAGLPKDAFWKGGAGGHGIYVVPSLDLVVFKLGGNEGQYDPALTRLPVKYSYDGSRDGWKPADPKLLGDSSPKTAQLVVSALTAQ
jgi:CubicO group peptidase (beta-lactamase class C family)